MEVNRRRVVTRHESINQRISDSPRLAGIVHAIKDEFSSYKFTVYRCAVKLNALRKALHTTDIPYKLVLSVLERHRLNQSDETISVRRTQLSPVIHDILFACDKLGHFAQQTAFDLEVTTGILSNFFWDVFDPNRSSPITLLEVKETFLLLCHVNSMDDMIAEFFRLAADHNKCISRFRLESVLKIITKILSYIGESSSYGDYRIPEILEQCFAQCQGMIGIDEYQFSCLWNTKSNRFMIYANLLALVKRISDTEILVHNIACTACSSPKITGIRFKCYTCRDLSLCIRCFSIGFSNSKHGMNHRVFEVYSDDLPVKKWTHYLTKLCNALFGKTGSQKSSDSKDNSELRAQLENKENADTSMEAAARRENKSIQCMRNSFSDTLLEPSGGIDRNLLDKLSTIITTLFQQREKLETRKQCLEESSGKSRSLCDLLNDQQSILLTVIDQLKTILENTQFSLPHVSSTPNRLPYKRAAIEASSPLTHSIHGISINRSYLDANKSDYSVNDMSTWLHHHNNNRPVQLHRTSKHVLDVINESTAIDTDMSNFRDLLYKVKEIVDDSYSDNNELAEATSHLETVLDSIIRDEEMKRRIYS